MPENEVYEIRVKSVVVDENPDGGGRVSVTYQGRAEEKTATQTYASDGFQDLFDCCQKIAEDITMSEFRPNTGVNFHFNLVNEEGISVWHTAPSNFLKMPLQMNMDWSCEHLRSSFKSYTTLGMIELPEEFHLLNGKLPTQKLVELLINSMVSGVEFIGMMFLQREQMGTGHHG